MSMACIFCEEEETVAVIIDDETGDIEGGVCDPHRKEFETPYSECEKGGCPNTADYSMRYVDSSGTENIYAAVCEEHLP